MVNLVSSASTFKIKGPLKLLENFKNSQKWKKSLKLAKKWIFKIFKLDLIQGAPCLEGLLNFLRAPYLGPLRNHWGTIEGPLRNHWGTIEGLLRDFFCLWVIWADTIHKPWAVNIHMTNTMQSFIKICSQVFERCDKYRGTFTYYH